MNIGVISDTHITDRTRKLPEKVFYQNDGSLVVAHPTDADELNKLKREVDSREFEGDIMQVLDAKGVGNIEPELYGRFYTVVR